jgi:hypothetical protein
LGEIGYQGPVGVMCYGIPGDAREYLLRSLKTLKTWTDENAKPPNAGLFKPEAPTRGKAEPAHSLAFRASIRGDLGKISVTSSGKERNVGNKTTRKESPVPKFYVESGPIRRQKAGNTEAQRTQSRGRTPFSP